MKVATLSGSNVQVEVVAVKGGWSTVRDLKTAHEFKVRNGSIEKVVTITEPQTLKAVKKIVNRKPREKKNLSERKNGKVDALYLQFYTATATVRDGRKVRSMDKGDDIAVELRQHKLEDVYTMVARATGNVREDLVARFKHLNLGMQRMNLGNMLRAKARKEAGVQ